LKWLSESLTKGRLSRKNRKQQAGKFIYANGDHIAVTTAEKSVRFLLISGKPIGEPLAWYGPIVMDSDEELQLAFEEYQNGTFIKHKKSSGI
jgi:redox-sensitive bicupin YhaK (pirin superfamily)